MTSILALAALAAVLPVQQQAQDGPPVTVNPAAVELMVGNQAQLSVLVAGEALDAAGVDATVRWTTSASEILEVDGSGRVRGLAVGSGRVAAIVRLAGGGTGVGFTTVHVAPQAAEQLEWSAPSTTLAVGASVPTRIVATGAEGGPVPAATVSFSSSDPQVARVDGQGRVFGLRAGSADLRAAGAGAEATIRITVESRAVTPRLQASAQSARTGDVVRFSMVDERTGAPLYPAWSVGDAGASIQGEGADGVFVAERPGTYRVTALLSDAHAASTVVEVEARNTEARLVTVGRGAISDHHSGDMWVFEGVDGRDYVYVGTFMHDWMKVFDVTDPTAPMLSDSVQMDARRINDVKIHPSGRLGIVTREGASSRRNGIVLLDLADPAHPTVLSEYTATVTGGVHNVWIDGEHDIVYAVHNGTSDVHVLDISDPANVREVNRWGLDRQSKTLHDVIIQDGYAYLSYWDDGVVILDAGAGTHGGSPTAPTFVSRYAYPIGNTHVAWRAGDYLFLGDEIFPPDWDANRPIEARGYIHVVDVSDIENPHEVAFYEVPEAGVHNVWADDDKLYVGYYQAGLRVLDISGELRGDLYAQGRELAVIKTTDADTMVPNWPMTWGAQVHKGRIYSSDMNSGIWVTRLFVGPRVAF